MTHVIAVLSAVVALVLCWLIVTQKYRFPLLMEAGMALVMVGFLSLADSFHTGTECAHEAVLARWGIVGVGTFMIIVSAAITNRMRKPAKKGHFPEIDRRDYHHINGGKR